MKKVAFLFAGQGAQYVGMGQELYNNYDVARKIYDSANEILNVDVKNLCFNGPQEELFKTVNTQPCILTTSYAIASVLKENGIEANFAGGLSLGEYSALAYAGVFTFEEGLKLIKKRGEFMENAVPAGNGGMAAIMGLERSVVEQYCRSNIEGIVEVANYNCPGQIVITGDKLRVERAAADLKELGALKTIVLNVSGPFHSSLMKKAGEKLESEIRGISINSTNKKVISNFDNEYYDNDVNNIIYKLTNQVSSSVMWEDNIRKLISEGIEMFIEIGPGKALSSFLKKIDRTKSILNVEDMKSLDRLLKELDC